MINYQVGVLRLRNECNEKGTTCLKIYFAAVLMTPFFDMKSMERFPLRAMRINYVTAGVDRAI